MCVELFPDDRRWGRMSVGEITKMVTIPLVSWFRWGRRRKKEEDERKGRRETEEGRRETERKKET